MARVVRLLTLVDLIDEHDEGPEARRPDVQARLEAVLDWDQRADAGGARRRRRAPSRPTGVRRPTSSGRLDAAEPQALPHDVELSGRVQGRIGRAA